MSDLSEFQSFNVTRLPCKSTSNLHGTSQTSEEVAKTPRKIILRKFRTKPIGSLIALCIAILLNFDNFTSFSSKTYMF